MDHAKSQKKENTSNYIENRKTTKHTTKFVVEIEKKIKTNLFLLKKSDGKLLEDKLIFSDQVLQVYREAFDTLLGNITTFKSLLFDIKEAYENSLNVRQEIIKLNDSLMRVMSSDKKRTNILTEENKKLERKIKDLENEISYLKKKNEKLEKESFTSYQALSIEKDARYTLLVENVKLRKENSKLANEGVKEKPKDQVILQLALEQCKKDLSNVSRKYNSTLEEYLDSIPKSKYDALEIEYYELEGKYNNMYKELHDLSEKYRNVLDYYQKHQNEEFEEVVENLIDSEEINTPRPQWKICAKYIAGDIIIWEQLIKGLSSRKILELFLKELEPIVKKENVEYFEGLGNDPVIPEYLRCTGKVRNLKLSRKEIYVLINNIWKSKDKETPMQDFLNKYITKRYQDSSRRTELAYSLYNGCKDILDDEHIKLFWGVLNGSLSQDIYYGFRFEWESIKKSTLDTLKNENLINISDFKRILKAVLSLKSDVEIQNIIEAVKKQLKLKSDLSNIDTTKLFMEYEEGFDHTDFAKELYHQRQVSQEKYIKEIIVQLGGKRNLNKLISVEDLKRAFVIIDPHIDHIIMESNLRWIFSDKTTNLHMIYPITLKTLLTKLSTGNIQRVGLKYKSRSIKYIKS